MTVDARRSAMNVIVAFHAVRLALPRFYATASAATFRAHILRRWTGASAGFARLRAAFSAAVPKELLGSLPRLRWVQSPAAGVGGLLSPALAESPIILTSARGIRARAIAEHVLGVTLALARQLHTAVRRQVAHQWALDELEASGLVQRYRVGAWRVIAGLDCETSLVQRPRSAARS